MGLNPGSSDGAGLSVPCFTHLRGFESYWMLPLDVAVISFTHLRGFESFTPAIVASLNASFTHLRGFEETD